MINAKGLKVNKSNVYKQIKASLGNIIIEAPEIGWKWADENYYVVKGTSDTPGPWISFGYQRGMIGIMTGEAVTRVIVKKCKRIGYTKCLTAAWCKFITEQRRSVGIWHPVDSDSKDFVGDEINPLFEVVPKLRDSLDADWKSKKDKNNTDSKKKFLGCTAYFRGGQSERSYRQITLSVAIIDELDGFTVSPDGHAEFVERAFGRTETAMNRKLIVGSTLKVKGDSLTEREFDDCEIKLFRHVKCSCGYVFPLSWENFFFTKSEDETKATDAYFVCTECKRELRYEDYPLLDEGGVWMTEDGIYYDEENDFLVRENGDIIEKVDSAGLYIWSAYSYFLTWIDLASAWIRAMNQARGGDTSLLKTFINEMLGKTYEERGGSLNSSIFTDRTEKYDDKQLPNEIDYLVAGCDVQSGEEARVEVIVVGVNKETQQKWHVGRYIVPCDIANPKTWPYLDETLFAIYQRRDGVNLCINVSLIDEGDGNNTENVRRYCFHRAKSSKIQGAAKRVIRSCKGTDRGHLVDFKGKDFGDVLTQTRTRVHFINHIAAKDTLYSNLRISSREEDNYIHFPEGLEQDYYDQLVNKRRTLQNKKVKYIVRNPSVRCEVLDCWVYAFGANNLYKIFFRVKSEKYD